ncbi:MAG: hypothetical protein RBS99_13365, partial [Rhodospirillales bacterium]|nr:hypothetical protein [Rhodospirillales bacterium]
RIAEMTGWSQNKIAAHLLERSLPLLKNALGEDDLMSIVRILRDGEFSVTIKPHVHTGRRGGQEAQ